MVAATLARPPATLAQSGSKVVGFLTPGFKDAAYSARKTAIAELARFGFIEGKNLVVEERYANGDASRLAALARELAAARPDVIIAVSNPAIQAAKDAAPSVPIIMAFAGEDPVAAGFISSLARPGGSITGIVMLAPEAEAKRVELAAQAVPGSRRIALLMTRYASDERVDAVQRSAAVLGLELTVVRVQDRSDYEETFKRLASAEVAMVVVGSSPVFFRDASELARQAAKFRLPVTCEFREMARQGCLLAYGPNVQKLYERVGDYGGRVLQGAKPQELPVEQPHVFDLAVNLKMARELGLTTPTSFTARADEVIE
jgi:putative ABC transport system substrate-binding protein